MNCGLSHTRVPGPDHYNRRQPGGYRVRLVAEPLRELGVLLSKGQQFPMLDVDSLQLSCTFYNK